MNRTCKTLSSLRLAVSGCLLAAAVSLGLAAPARADFGFSRFDVSALDSNRLPETQAGAHPYTLTTRIAVLTDAEGVPLEDVRKTEVDFPPGLIGNPLATPKCELTDLTSFDGCSPATQVGVVFQGVTNTTVGIYNLVPEDGVPAQLGFKVTGIPVVLTPTVRPGDFGLTTTSEGINETLDLDEVSVQLWGVPGDPSHDPQREPGFECGKDATDPEIEDPECPENGVPFGGPRIPFLSNPGDCGAGPLPFALRGFSWVDPFDVKALTHLWHDDAAPANPVGMTGCDLVPFAPTATAVPTTTAADFPSGLEVKMHFPQDGLLAKDGIAPSPLRKAVVSLPEGMTINPSSANGLQACADAQLGIGLSAPVACPDASKIGAVTASTPILDEPLNGSVYLRTQASGVPESGEMFRLAIVLANENRGLLFKLPGQTRVDSATGRVTAVFDRNPQQPVEDITVTLKSGPRAPLATPVTCGQKTVSTELTGWSGKIVSSSNRFGLSSGPGAGACPASAAARPFAPAFQAGLVSGRAGGSSPFGLKLTRPDGNQEIAALGVDLPAGLLAKLAGTRYCSDAELASVSAVPGTGRNEIASPSCPAASRVGTAIVGAGAGSAPFYADTGKAYLAGPYKGSPLSLAVVAPAVAGPFDLGSVVVRNRLAVDADDAQAHVISDPLPQMVAGVPLRIRDIRVNIDKPGFMRSPTSCAPKSILAKVSGADGASVERAASFQVADCGALPFKPKLSFRYKGKTHRSAHPAVTATLKARKGDANIGKAVVTLPKTQFLEQGHIRTICTRVQYAANSCPKGSVYGYAKAWTPLLDQPLQGPVVLRSSNNTLPDLVADLNGQIEIDLSGRIDSVNSRMRVSFGAVPDAPVSKFVLRMQGGKKGLLVNNTELCKTKPRASAVFTGQNGKRFASNPLVKLGCGKGKR